jgi:hypothetical protein
VAANGGLATVIPNWSLWDVGCGVLLIREAGRVIWGSAGQTLEPECLTTEVALLAGSPAALRLLVADDWARLVLDRQPLASGERGEEPVSALRVIAD